MTNTHVILVRHGETTANHEQRWYGAMDAPLTERGRLQVQATGERFAHRRTSNTIGLEHHPTGRMEAPMSEKTTAGIQPAMHPSPTVRTS